jgi:hypothetical protein
VGSLFCSVHGKKTFLGHLDRMFNSFTYQAAEPIPKPATPPPPEPMTMDTLFHDQLIKAVIPEHEKISDQELNTLLNSTSGPENYGPRVEPERNTPAAIVAALDKQLARQRKEEAALKRQYENIAAAHVAEPAAVHDQTSATEEYSMATFVTRLEQHSQDFAAAAKTGKFNTQDGSSFVSPPKLDLSKLNHPKPGLKVNHGKDAYSIDVHALRLPDILSPPSDAYFQQQKTPILCIYSPPPLEGSPPQRSYTSPEGPRSFSPEVAAVGRGSPIQLQGTLTASAGKHAASSPAIMYISSPGLQPTSSAYNLSQSGAGAHNKSTASLPIVSQHRGPHEDNHLHHQYQTIKEYQKSLHPQTREFVTSMLTTQDPDFHTDPRNYRSSAESVGDESIYDYDAEFEDLTAEPRGDSGALNIHTHANLATLPANAVQHGGEALLALGYQYQHSTNTFVHKDERNRSRFGQYERSPLGDPYAADFSNRHLQAIRDTTVGTAVPVVYIPPGAPAAEPALDKQHRSTVLALTNGSSVPSAADFTHDPMHVNRKGKMALSPREVMKGPSYAPVRTVMQHPHDVPLNAIHYRGDGVSPAQHEPDVYDAETAARRRLGSGLGSRDSDNDEYDEDSFRILGAPAGAPGRRTSGAGVISADNSTLNTHTNPVAEVQQEICAYIDKLAEQTRADRAGSHGHAGYGASSVQDTATASEYSAQRQAERARVKLWDKLNNRYGGDREGDFVRKQAIKEYIYDGVKADTQIMREYLKEMEEGWVT